MHRVYQLLRVSATSGGYSVDDWDWVKKRKISNRGPTINEWKKCGAWRKYDPIDNKNKSRFNVCCNILLCISCAQWLLPLQSMWSQCGLTVVTLFPRCTWSLYQLQVLQAWRVQVVQTVLTSGPASAHAALWSKPAPGVALMLAELSPFKPLC